MQRNSNVNDLRANKIFINSVGRGKGCTPPRKIEKIEPLILY